jgi:hypothetical protein
MARTTFDGPIRVRRGATVTQATSRSTGVTINAPAGQITMNAASLAAGAEAKFTVTNSFVTATSVPVVALKSGQTADTSMVFVSAVADGSFEITVSNLAAATADTGAGVINFIVFQGSNAAAG